MSSSISARKRFFIIDGYALLFRAHFALIANPLITEVVAPYCSALFGFIVKYLKLMRNDPEYLCAFDSTKGKRFDTKFMRV